MVLELSCGSHVVVIYLFGILVEGRFQGMELGPVCRVRIQYLELFLVLAQRQHLYLVFVVIVLR